MDEGHVTRGDNPTNQQPNLAKEITRMSVYDSKDLMTVRAASREFDVPTATLQMAIVQGGLRLITREGESLLSRPDVEQFVKRTIKQGAGNRVVTHFGRQGKSQI